MGTAGLLFEILKVIYVEELSSTYDTNQTRWDISLNQVIFNRPGVAGESTNSFVIN